MPISAALEQVLNHVEQLGPVGPAVFVAAYAAACVLFIPGSVLTLGAGAVFGVVKGSVLVSVASTLGASLSFLIGRYAARGWVARKLEGRPRFSAVDTAAAREGWKIVLLTRLSPVFPFTLLNYAYGLTRVSFRDYILASWIGMMPGTVMYVYLGSLARLGLESERASHLQTAMKVVGLAATIAVTLYITRIARKALEEKI